MPVLEIKNLSVAFGGVQALSQVHLSIETGEIRALIGPNGAGKSTLFNAVTGVVRTSGGQILFKGQNITGLKPYQVALLGIARTYQNLKLFNDMTVLDNVIVGGLCGTKTRFLGSLFSHPRTNEEDRLIRKKAESTLELLGLVDLRHSHVKGLPYGQRKAIELARALATEPEIILLDEPKAGMNMEETEAIMRILQKISEQGFTIFLIEHDMPMVMGLSDRISVLDFGCKIAEGTPDEITRNERVIKAYLGH
jgi:branched-chain amino acid transport system ATP-binding protein